MAKSKTEIDKDLMYRKIMPTASRSSRAAASDERSKAAPEGGGANVLGNTQTGSAGAVRETNVNPEPPDSEYTNSFRSVRPRPAAGLQLPESQDMLLINLMEDLVISRLESTLMRFNCCKCNKCKKDITAIALNKLTPRYVVMRRDDGERRRKTEEEYGSTVTNALVQAIMLVKKEPRH